MATTTTNTMCRRYRGYARMNGRITGLLSLALAAVCGYWGIDAAIGENYFEVLLAVCTAVFSVMLAEAVWPHGRR